MRKPKWGFWVFLAPAMISFILIQAIPTLMGIFYSFTDWNGIGKLCRATELYHDNYE